MASSPEKVSNGWRTRWYYKGKKQSHTTLHEGDCKLAQAYIESLGDHISKDDPLLRERVYLRAGDLSPAAKKRIGIRTFAMVAESYMNTKDWAPTTLKKFKSRLATHYVVWNDFDIAEFTHEHLNAKFRELTALGLMYNTVISYLEPALQIFSYAYDMKWLEVNPTHSRRLAFTRTMERSETRVALTHEELQALLELAPDLITYDIVNTMAQCGLRIGEVLALAVEDVDLVERTMTVRATMVKSTRQPWSKGNRRRPPRIIAINDEFCLVLAGYLFDATTGEVRSGREPLFPSRVMKTFRNPDRWRERVWTPMRHEAEEKKLVRPGVDLVPHILRHSMATFYSQHIPIRLVGQRLGHKTEKTTNGYVHRDFTLERDVMDRIYSAPGRERLVAALN